MNNPYQPSTTAIPADRSRRYDESKSILASWSWKLPLCGLLATILINFLASSFGAVGALIFIGCVIAGFFVSLIGLVLAFSYRRVARHALSGLILNVVLGVSIGGMFVAVQSARQAAIRQQQRQLNGSTGNTAPTPRNKAQP